MTTNSQLLETERPQRSYGLPQSDQHLLGIRDYVSGSKRSIKTLRVIPQGYSVVCARAGLKTCFLYLIWCFLVSLCLIFVYYLLLKNTVIPKSFQSHLCGATQCMEGACIFMSIHHSSARLLSPQAWPFLGLLEWSSLVHFPASTAVIKEPEVTTVRAMLFSPFLMPLPPPPAPLNHLI